MRFINQKARALYEEIKRRAVVVEDSYVIPQEEECFDTMDGELYYGSDEFFTSTFDKWEKCEKSGNPFEETVIQIVSDFVLVSDEIFVTKEGLAKIKEFLGKGVLEKMWAQKRKNEQDNYADMQAAKKEKEEQDAFPGSSYW